MNSIVEVSDDLAKRQVNLEFLWLELTNKCNLQCTHCYAESGPHSEIMDSLNINDYIRILKEAFELGCRHVQFIGGEPTLNRSLPDYIEYTRSTGYTTVEVFSNLYHLPEELFLCFLKHDVNIATSFYSDCPEIHDSITQRSGSFERTISNIQKILHSNLHLRVCITVMNENEQRISHTIKFLNDLGIPNVSVDRLRKFGRACEGNISSGMSELCGNCAGQTLCIGPDGQVSPCIMSKLWPVGSVINQPLAAISGSRQLREIRSAIYTEAVLPQIQREQDLGIASMLYDCGPCNPVCNPCNPWCSPGQQCNPCNPNGGQPCNPNGRCAPR